MDISIEVRLESLAVTFNLSIQQTVCNKLVTLLNYDCMYFTCPFYDIGLHMTFKLVI